MYTADISRINPACFLFLIDQTGSMSQRFGLSEQTKAEALADAVNRMLSNLVIRCTKEDGVRNYFHCGMVGFGRSVEPLGPAWEGALAGRTIVPISEIALQPLRIADRQISVADGAGGLQGAWVRLPTWVEPRAELGQPAPGHHNLIARACDLARSLLEPWVCEHPNGFPPTVVLVTDGGEEGGDPVEAAERLKNVATADGNTLLYCCHISAVALPPIMFPDTDDRLGDAYARMLFRMASSLPQTISSHLRSSEMALGESPRGFAFNADVGALIRFLDIGTRVADLVDLRPRRWEKG